MFPIFNLIGEPLRVGSIETCDEKFREQACAALIESKSRFTVFKEHVDELHLAIIQFDNGSCYGFETEDDFFKFMDCVPKASCLFYLRKPIYGFFATRLANYPHPSMGMILEAAPTTMILDNEPVYRLTQKGFQQFYTIDGIPLSEAMFFLQTIVTCQPLMTGHTIEEYRVHALKLADRLGRLGSVHFQEAVEKRIVPDYKSYFERALEQGFMERSDLFRPFLEEDEAKAGHYHLVKNVSEVEAILGKPEVLEEVEKRFWIETGGLSLFVLFPIRSLVGESRQKGVSFASIRRYMHKTFFHEEDALRPNQAASVKISKDCGYAIDNLSDILDFLVKHDILRYCPKGGSIFLGTAAELMALKEPNGSESSFYSRFMDNYRNADAFNKFVLASQVKAIVKTQEASSSDSNTPAKHLFDLLLKEHPETADGPVDITTFAFPSNPRRIDEATEASSSEANALVKDLLGAVLEDDDPKPADGVIDFKTLMFTTNPKQFAKASSSSSGAKKN